MSEVKEHQTNCCKQENWYIAWNKFENTLRSSHHDNNNNINKHSSIGFDLWIIAHGLRDCLLIDHGLWRQKHIHSKLIQHIQQFAKVIFYIKSIDKKINIYCIKNIN